MLYIASPVKAAFYDGAGGFQGPAAVSYGRANYELARLSYFSRSPGSNHCLALRGPSKPFQCNTITMYKMTLLVGVVVSKVVYR